MLYYVRRFPDAGTEAQQSEALARLVANAGSLTMHAVRVGSNAGLYIDVPEAITSLVELRVLPALVGMEGCLERRKAWVQRPEWALHALLTPTADAQHLDITVLERSVSACITLHWTRAGVAGHLWASADDVPLLDRIEERGWRARVVADGVAGHLAVLLHRPRITTLQPILAQRPPAMQIAASPGVMPMSSETPDDSAAGAATKDDTVLPPFVAKPGEMGLVLGMDARALPLALAFRPQRLAVDAPDVTFSELVTILLERAFELHAGVVAIVPRAVAQELRRFPWRERLRWLDGADPYQSASIPWRSLPPDALDAALLAGNVLPSGSGSLASSFATLLEQTGAATYATDTVRSLTALPGDDLRGVVAAGGGVVLVDDGDVGSPLLAALLLHLLAMLPPLQRPIVLFRPGRISVPDAVASQTLDIVLGTATAAHSTLAQTDDGWMLTSADGSWQRTLLADLRNLTAAPDASAHRTLMVGLEGGDELVAPLQLRTTELPIIEELQDESSSGERAHAPIVSAPLDRTPALEAAASTTSESFWDDVDDAVRASLSDEPVTTVVHTEPTEMASQSGTGSDTEAATNNRVDEPTQPSEDGVEDGAAELSADELSVLFADEALAEEQVADQPDSDVLDLFALEADEDVRAHDQLLDGAVLEAIDLQPFSGEMHVEAPAVASALDLIAHETPTDSFADGMNDRATQYDQADETAVADELTSDGEGQHANRESAVPRLASLDDWNVSLGDDSLVAPQRATTWPRHPRRRRWTARATSVTPQEQPTDEQSQTEEAQGSVAFEGLHPHSVVRASDRAFMQQDDDGAASDTLAVTVHTTSAPYDDPTPIALPISTADPIERSSEPPPSQPTPSTTVALDLTPVADQLQAGIAEGMGLPALIAQVAPRYPHVAPAALRAAIRQFVADAGAQLVRAPLPSILLPVALPLNMSTQAPAHVDMSTEETNALRDEEMSTEETSAQVDISPEETFAQTNMPAQVDIPTADISMSTDETFARVDMSTHETLTLRDVDMSTDKTFAQMDMSAVGMSMSTEETRAQVDTPTADISMSTEETFARVDLSTDETPVQVHIDEPFLSTAEAAAELGVTPKTIQRWEDDGKITTLRYGRTRLIPRSEVARIRATPPSR